LSSIRCLSNRRKNSVISGAPAHVATHCRTKVTVIPRDTVANERDAPHDLSRSAKPTLERTEGSEGLTQCEGLLGNTLDCLDMASDTSGQGDA
jgi:hypothetical protein